MTDQCPECKEPILMALAEPEAKPVRLNARKTKAWIVNNITGGEHGNVARAVDVHELHSLTCKAVNRT